eukprot:gene4041-7330_t
MNKLAILFIFSVLCFINAQNDIEYNKTMKGFFNDFFDHQKTCSAWTRHFNPNGVFYHPTLPSGVSGFTALEKFCQSTNSEFPRKISKFTPRGDLPLFTKGKDGSVWATVPYAFGGINKGIQFLNYGHLTFELDSNAKILKAIETWERKRWE